MEVPPKPEISTGHLHKAYWRDKWTFWIAIFFLVRSAEEKQSGSTRLGMKKRKLATMAQDGLNVSPATFSYPGMTGKMLNHAGIGGYRQMDRDTALALIKSEKWFSIFDIEGYDYDYAIEFVQFVWNLAIERAAKECDQLWSQEAKESAEGIQKPKYHDCIECAYAIRQLKED